MSFFLKIEIWLSFRFIRVQQRSLKRLTVIPERTDYMNLAKLEGQLGNC